MKKGREKVNINRGGTGTKVRFFFFLLKVTTKKKLLQMANVSNLQDGKVQRLTKRNGY